MRNRDPLPQTSAAQTPAAQTSITQLSFVRGAWLSRAAAGDMGPSGGAPNAARSAVFDALGVERSVTVQQQHTRDLLVLEDFARATQHSVLGIADGVVCDGSQAVWLGVTVADCVPIFLSAGEGGPCALLHSGRKGTGILVKAVKLIERRYGVKAHELDVLIGPAIGGCCYEVGQDCAHEFALEWGVDAVHRRPHGLFLNLPELNAGLAAAHGVRRVQCMNHCTCCDTQLGSYRREGPDSYRRMLALLQVRNNTL